MKKYFYIFLISMLPVIELTGSIPIGFGLGIPWLPCFVLSVIGNFLPVPFILLFIRKILKWMKEIKYLKKIAEWIENKAHKHSHEVLKYASFGLMLFVAVPFPGTGVWTGSLIAALLDMRLRYALPSIFIGLVITGLIVSGVSYGFLGFLKFLVF